MFNNFLSFNDGLLVNYVAKQKDIDTIVATDQVFEYVDKLKKELDESGTYVIDRLGSFKKDSNGILRFQQSEDFADLLNEDSINPPDRNTDDKSDVVDEPKKKVFVLDVDEPDDKSEAIPTRKKVEAKTDVGAVETSEAKKVVVPPVASAPEKEKVEEKKVQLKKNTPVEDRHKKKNNSGLVIFLIITAIIIIILGVYFLWLKKPSEKQPKIVEKEVVKPVSKPAVVKDTVAVKHTVQQNQKPVKAKPSVVRPMKGQIHIIVGGFAEAANAHKMVDKLKKQGFSNAQLITKGSMHLVSIDSGTSYTKVEARQQEILDQRIESWLYTIK
ncbi:SPOR domain-containing protein [Saccharicrinis fermentans]|uniref:SPOR domain-containing protein n=1 Tax=Saccharicrinis fermentans DSM 9555 = JCM 21142 TaxID=869213 RepID=W7Y2G1_9BACT|nr:SPOR domain-containing protein [Saccharicrinis fermentans]GAF01728.1 hypothetical protein JCM21142_342 [Saccharicrinis fermentans DSM 9555 = JCM 21142]